MKNISITFLHNAILRVEVYLHYHAVTRTTVCRWSPQQATCWILKKIISGTI